MSQGVRLKSPKDELLKQEKEVTLPSEAVMTIGLWNERGYCVGAVVEYKAKLLFCSSHFCRNSAKSGTVPK